MKKTCDRCSEPLVLGLNEYYPCECPETSVLLPEPIELPAAFEVFRTTEEVIQRTMDQLAGRRRDG